MLAKLHVQYVIVGHSERRELFGETDEIVAEEAPRGLATGMTPIVCVGETLEEREQGSDRRQGAGSDRGRVPASPGRRRGACVVAYEPIWAIGTGRNATPEDANETIGVIRAHCGSAWATTGRRRCGSCTAGA